MNNLFYISAFVAIISSLMVITRRNAIHALLYLVLSLLSIAGIFYTLGAAYAAILEIIIYAGAIVILFVFVVMMLNVNQNVKEEKQNTKLKYWIIPAILSSILIGEFIYALFENGKNIKTINVIGAKMVGMTMFSKYLIVVELAGILLLAGIVGAYHLGRTKKRNLHRYNNLPEKSVEDGVKNTNDSLFSDE
jgi:NADH-quinone oxidoreductase subunit J